MTDTDGAASQYEEALEVARWSLAEFRKAPTVTSKRGHDILNPLWRVYVDASQIAWRWAREIQGGESLDDDLAHLLSDE